MKRIIVALVIVEFIMGCTAIKVSEQSNKNIDQRVDSLLSLMTLEEKIGQLVLFTSHWDVTGPVMRESDLGEIKSGKCGNVFNAHTAAYTYELQRIAVEESRLGIPMLFGYDVIHGHKTIFPISLGEAASWDLEAIEKSARVSAIEAAVSGINWTFAPMCDISVDPRWGRVSEGAGEDPFLGSRIAEARVRGFQGKDNNLADPFTILACVKHFAAYGAPVAGRDYNTVDMSERSFRGVYLPPYKAAINAGALSVMASFNELNGVPATSNKWLMTDLLRNELGFKGFVVSDYSGIAELIPHGVTDNLDEAANLAFNSGVDMDMQSGAYFKCMKDLVESGKVSSKSIDEACRRILAVKFQLGLFDNPYLYCDTINEKKYVYAPEHLDAAYDVAKRSFVLLKNDSQTLPLNKSDKLAVIGELANSKRDLLGSWKAAGDWDFITTLLDELKLFAGEKNVLYAEGCKKFGDDRSMFEEAITIAKGADKIIFAMGEDNEWTGEATSRTSIKIPGVQSELLEKLRKLNKPIVIVLMNGRPLDLSVESEMASAILETWYAGTKGAKAITDVLYGVYNPSGKLPMTFPRNVGQIPIYYYAKNTGRPKSPEEPKYRSQYIDSPNTPLFPFGFGLSYTSFKYSNLQLSGSVLKLGQSISVKVKITNSGSFDGEEVAQLYLQDIVGSVTRPIKELKGFQKLFIKVGETKEVEFMINHSLLAFHRLDMSYGTEPGSYNVFVGTNSNNVLSAKFSIE